MADQPRRPATNERILQLLEEVQAQLADLSRQQQELVRALRPQ
jgi:hypothetical protein